MKILNAISEALRAKKAPDSTKLAELLAQTKNETAAARTRLDDLEARRSEMALASESERLAYRSDLTSTRDDVADGEAAIDALRAKHAVAVEAEAEDGRKQVYKAAKAEADKLSGLIDEYAKAAQAVRDVIRRIAEIDAVVLAANRDLPADTARIADSGTLRGIPAEREEVISEKVVELWARPGATEPMGEAYQKNVIVDRNGQGYVSHTGGAVNLTKMRCARREVKKSTTGVGATGFHEVNLPAAYADATAIFVMRNTQGVVAPNAIVAAADAAIEAGRAGRKKSDRPVVVEIVPVRNAA